MKKETIGILLTIGAVLLSFLMTVLPAFVFPVNNPDLPADLEQHRIIGNSRMGTNPKAPLDIIIFEDFKCPHCRDFQDTLTRIMVVYGNKVNIIPRNYPKIDGSRLPAIAAECAREQGRYWEYHTNLFRSEGSLDMTDLSLIADKSGLDVNKFVECMDTQRPGAIIDEDLVLAESMLVRGTPTIFIDGRKIEGDEDYSVFKKMIDEALADD